MDNFHYNAIGAEDYVSLGAVDLSGYASAQLLYRIAYKPHSENRIDALRMEVSNDCGNTFHEISYAEGLDLASVDEYQNGEWMPSSPDEWDLRTINLDAYAGDTVILRIANINGRGNYIYLDDIQMIGSVPLAVQFIDLEVLSDRSGNHIVIWESANEVGLEKYYVEASENGLEFVPVSMITPDYQNLNRYLLRF